MKTTIAILVFLVCSIGLGCAYAFTPRKLTVGNPNFSATKQLQVTFSKDVPFCQVRQKLEVVYLGEKPTYIEALGNDLKFDQIPAEFRGGCWGPDMYLVKTSNSYTGILPLKMDSNQLTFVGQVRISDASATPTRSSYYKVTIDL